MLFDAILSSSLTRTTTFEFYHDKIDTLYERFLTSYEYRACLTALTVLQFAVSLLILRPLM